MSKKFPNSHTILVNFLNTQNTFESQYFTSTSSLCVRDVHARLFRAKSSPFILHLKSPPPGLGWMICHSAIVHEIFSN